MVATQSPVHPASLSDPSTHSPAILELIDVKINRPVIDYVVDCVVECVDYALGRPSSSVRGRPHTRRPEHAKFTTFVTTVITRAEITTPTLLATLVYIDRARPHLHIALEEWALERVFLGALIVASKYLNDSTLKNVHWALCTGVFGKRDIGRIEREYLDVLDFELSITEDGILSHHQSLMSVALGLHRSHSEKTRSRAADSPHHQLPSPSSSRNHRRRTSVPDLEPSSPESSSTSSYSSPQTPSSTGSSPAHDPTHKSAPHSKKSVTSTTMEILRSFPLPIPGATHQSRSWRQSLHL
ncbi:hypothetical protein AX14_008462 [Amanita brunnescens Koide BX004]|nr:hypothetical protein AX14_008462 [Amanita brunnescens Koide BX004]